MFLSIVGAEAGHMALRSLATGGVYVCGGIPPRVSLGGLAAGEESAGWVACEICKLSHDPMRLRAYKLPPPATPITASPAAPHS